MQTDQPMARDSGVSVGPFSWRPAGVTPSRVRPVIRRQAVATIFSSWRTVGVKLAKKYDSLRRREASLPAL